MNKLLLLLFLCCVEIASSQLYYSNPIDIGTGGLHGYRPRIAVINDTTPLVTWNKAGSPQGMYFSEWVYSPSYFDSPQQLLPGGLHLFAGIIDGPEMAVKGDTVYIASWVMRDTLNDIVLLRSFNGGNTFVDTNIVYTTIKRVEFPVITILDDGSVAIAFMISELDETLPYLVFTKSLDQGQSWSAPVTFSTLNPGQPCECCPLNLSASQNHVFVSYRNNVSDIRDFHTVVSHDFGSTFSNGFAIDTSDFISFTCPTSGVDGVISNDTLYSVFSTKVGSMYQLKMSRNHVNDTVAFNHFFFPGVSQNHPAITASGDTLGVVWQQTSNAQDVFLSYKIGASAWSAPVNLTNAAGSQTTPDIMLAGGYFHIVYYDQGSANRPRYIRAGFSPITLGTEELYQQKEINVFPNPFSTELNIYAEGMLYLIDGAGTVLLSGKQVEIKNRALLLEPGLYFIRSQAGSVQKIIRL